MGPLPFIFLGIGLIAYLVRKKEDNMPTAPKPLPPGGNMKFLPNNKSDWEGWVWPVVNWGGREPIISHEFEAGSRYSPDGTLNKGAHMGVDIMFKRIASDPTGPKDTVAIPKNSRTNLGYIANKGTQIVASGPGIIWRCGTSARGMWIQIDHGTVGSAGGVNTYYQHLDSFAKKWKKGDRVVAGQLLGTMGGDPSTSQKLRHLHFELWKPVTGQSNNDWPKDPGPIMKHWKKITTPTAS